MSRVWTKVLLLLPVAGAVLFLIGIDAICCFPASWWDRTGFVVNIVSAATAASIGIPFAFFGLQKLLRDGERDRTRRELKRRIIGSLRLMQADAKETFGLDPTTLHDVSRKAKRIGAILFQLGQDSQGARVVSAERFNEANESLKRLITEVEAFHIFHFPGGTDANWSRLERTWKVLEDRLLVDAAIEEIDPFSAQLVVDLNRYVTTFGDDFSTFWEVSAGRSLWNLSAWFERIAEEESEFSLGDGRLRIPNETPGLDLVEPARGTLKQVHGRLDSHQTFRMLLRHAEEMAEKALAHV